MMDVIILCNRKTLVYPSGAKKTNIKIYVCKISRSIALAVSY